MEEWAGNSQYLSSGGLADWKVGSPSDDGCSDGPNPPDLWSDGHPTRRSKVRRLNFDRRARRTDGPIDRRKFPTVRRLKSTVRRLKPTVRRLTPTGRRLTASPTAPAAPEGPDGTGSGSRQNRRVDGTDGLVRGDPDGSVDRTSLAPKKQLETANFGQTRRCEAVPGRNQPNIFFSQSREP